MLHKKINTKKMILIMILMMIKIKYNKTNPKQNRSQHKIKISKIIIFKNLELAIKNITEVIKHKINPRLGK